MRLPTSCAGSIARCSKTPSAHSPPSCGNLPQRSTATICAMSIRYVPLPTSSRCAATGCASSRTFNISHHTQESNMSVRSFVQSGMHFGKLAERKSDMFGVIELYDIGEPDTVGAYYVGDRSLQVHSVAWYN